VIVSRPQSANITCPGEIEPLNLGMSALKEWSPRIIYA
jgi:hypothetical protein